MKNMKKQQMNTSSLFRAVLFAAFAFLTTGASAQTPAVTPQISYLGKVNGKPVIQVEIENSASSPLTISLQNPEGELLYSSRFSDARFSRKFMIDPEESNDIQLTVILSNGKQRESRVIRLSSQPYVREDFSVTMR
jgi:hypothetical protein